MCSYDPVLVHDLCFLRVPEETLPHVHTPPLPLTLPHVHTPPLPLTLLRSLGSRGTDPLAWPCPVPDMRTLACIPCTAYTT